MNPNTIRLIRAEGNKLYEAVNKELYSNAAGLKPRTELSKIFRRYEVFGDPGLFLSLSGGSEEEAEDASIMLIRQFLLESFLNSMSANLTDRILTFETETEFKAGGKKLAFRRAESRLISERSKYKRDEITKQRNETLEKIIPEVRRRLGVLTEGAERIGFRSYIELMDDVHALDTQRLIQEARRVLADTEYVSREMLGWFFGKKSDLKPGDASVHDMYYLLNSAELHGLFPKTDLMAFSKRVLEENGLNPETNISIDTAIRKGKAKDGHCLVLYPPCEIAIIMYPTGGVMDYELFFGFLGHALSYGFTKPDDDFEVRSLRDESLVRVFSELFKSLIYETKWLKKYLRIDADADFMKFLNLRRLMSARLTAGRVIYEAELYKNTESVELSPLFKAITENASQCSADEREYLSTHDLRPSSFNAFKGMLFEPLFRWYLQDKFDEEWWRIPAAGDHLKDLWREGGKLTTRKCSLKTGIGEPGAKALIDSYEQKLG